MFHSRFCNQPSSCFLFVFHSFLQFRGMGRLRRILDLFLNSLRLFINYNKKKWLFNNLLTLVRSVFEIFQCGLCCAGVRVLHHTLGVAGLGSADKIRELCVRAHARVCVKENRAGLHGHNAFNNLH